MSNSVECDVCGEKFIPKFKRRKRPQRFCSDKCRKIHQREYMFEYQKRKRERKYKDINRVHRKAHNEMRQSTQFALDSDEHGHIDPRIDRTHDSWDFIPARIALSDGAEIKMPAYNAIGTISERDLAVVDHKGQQRVVAALRINK